MVYDHGIKLFEDCAAILTSSPVFIMVQTELEKSQLGEVVELRASSNSLLITLIGH